MNAAKKFLELLLENHIKVGKLEKMTEIDGKRF
jgi:hypothetical protein